MLDHACFRSMKRILILAIGGIFVVPGCSQPPTGGDGPKDGIDSRVIQTPVRLNSPKYAAGCSVPLKNWRTEKDGIGHLRVPILVTLASDGTLKWGDETILDQQLEERMVKAGNLAPQPQIILEVSPSAECSRVETIRRIMDRTQICQGPYSSCSEGNDSKNWKITGGP